MAGGASFEVMVALLVIRPFSRVTTWKLTRPDWPGSRVPRSQTRVSPSKLALGVADRNVVPDGIWSVILTPVNRAPVVFSNSILKVTTEGEFGSGGTTRGDKDGEGVGTGVVLTVMGLGVAVGEVSTERGGSSERLLGGSALDRLAKPSRRLKIAPAKGARRSASPPTITSVV